MSDRLLDPETIRRSAAALGIELSSERARTVASGANPVLETMTRRTDTLRFESEPAGYLAELERARQR